MPYTESMSYDRSSTLHDTSTATCQVQNGGGVCIGKTEYGLMRAHMRSRVP